MTMTTTIGDVHLPSALDLRAEAEEALARDETIRVERHSHYAHPAIIVETLVIEAPGGASGDIGRAGQVTNGDAVWGDWDEATQTITTDDGIRVYLDGRQDA